MVRSWGVATVIAGTLLAAACTTQNSTSTSSASGSAATTASTQPKAPVATPALSGDVATTLSAAPLIVDPQLDPTATAKGVVGPAGGELTLALTAADGTKSTSAATVTLHVPPGALRRGTHLMLIGVTSLGVAAATPASWRAVELLPSSVMFASGAVPSMTFTGVDQSFGSSGVSWDANGVATDTVPTAVAASSATFAVATGGGYGGGNPQALTSQRAFGDLWQPILDAIGAGNTDSALALIEQRRREFLLPLVAAAAQQCGAVLRTTIRIWATIEALAQKIGSDANRGDELGPIVRRMADCAREACTRGETSAGAQLLEAIGVGQAWGSVDEPTLAQWTDEYTRHMKECATWRIKLFGSTVFHSRRLGEGYESFTVNGSIRRRGTTPVAMTVSSRNNAGIQTGLGIGIATAFGGPSAGARVKCTVGPYGPSLARVTSVVGEATPGAPDTPPPLTITIDPVVGPAAVSCGGTGTVADYTTLLFLVPALKMEGVKVRPEGLQHTFVPAEYDGLEWLYSESFDLPPSSDGEGTVSLAILVTPFGGEVQAPPTVPADALDWASMLNEILHNGA